MSLDLNEHIVAPLNKLTDEERKIIVLLPCPFCGGHALINMGVGEFWVKCEICRASIDMHNTEYHACEEWNRRYKS